MIDCTGIDKVKLLQQLWNNSKTANFFAMSGVSPPPCPSYQEFEKAAEGYVDYLGSRVIKTNFKDYPNLDPWGYDRDNGSGAMQRAVDSFK